MLIIKNLSARRNMVMDDVAKSFADTLKKQMARVGDKFPSESLINVHPRARERSELARNLKDYIAKINQLGSEKYEAINAGVYNDLFEIRRIV